MVPSGRSFSKSPRWRPVLFRLCTNIAIVKLEGRASDPKRCFALDHLHVPKAQKECVAWNVEYALTHLAFLLVDIFRGQSVKAFKNALHCYTRKIRTQ